MQDQCHPAMILLIPWQEELTNVTNEMVALGLPEAHIDGAYDKLCCKMHDPAFPLRMLPPYNGISDATFKKIVAMIRKKYPRWI